MRQIDIRKVSILDLNFNIGADLPAFVQLDGVLFAFNNTEVEDGQLLTNYNAVLGNSQFRHLKSDQLASLVESAQHVSLSSIYAMQEMLDAPATSASYQWIKFSNGGWDATDGVRWNRNEWSRRD